MVLFPQTTIFGIVQLMLILVSLEKYTSSCNGLLFCADQIDNLISCSLSVSKWIHLNWGDDGLIALFFKVWMLLQPVYDFFKIV